MASENRRSFLRKSTLSLATLGSLTAEASVKTLSFQRKIVYLWDDKSQNNGTDPEKRPRLEFYIPDTQTRRGAIVVCPGGGYGGLAKHEGAPFAELFAAHGFVSAVLTYRVAPHRYPAPYADATRAIRVVRSMAGELGIDSARIGIMGFSAGGHLVSTVATQPNLYKDPEDSLAATVTARPDRVMMGYPVISFQEFSHTGSVKNLLGPQPNPDLMRQLSNHQQVTAETPPAFLFHTTDDQVVPVQNSLLFAEACARNKVPLALHVYPNGRHGVGLATDNPDLKSWTDLLLTWLGPWK